MDRRTFIKLASGSVGMLLVPAFGSRLLAAERIEKISKTADFTEQVGVQHHAAGVPHELRQ